MDGLVPRLWRWRFNLTTGATTEGLLDSDPERITEFGMFNQQYAGRKYRYAYSTLLKPSWLLFTGVTKHDLLTGDACSYVFGEGRYASEAPFASRIGATSEDDGYLVTFVTDMREGRSECVLLDAKDIAKGPVCVLQLPHRISSGTHSTWVSREQLRTQPKPRL
jgi:carotenoid cleavage dioxygenase